MKKIERRLTDFVDEKIGNATKATCDKVEKTYSAVVDVETNSEKPKGDEIDENSKSHNINEYIRIQGIPEDPNITKGEILSQKRRKLLDGGVPKKNLNIRNLELYYDGDRVQLDIQNALAH